ncbi:MAG TPA: acyl-CoA synthetase [Mycobacteriales bacterium]|nr:acyl-CoA synthetase [Mycobacteriales bacterium]
MYIGDYAGSAPDRAAVIMASSGERMSYGELFDGSNRFARVLRESGLVRGDHVAIMAENNLRYFEVVWACLNSGLYITAISAKLTAAEAAYILRDSAAKALVTTRALADVAEALVADTSEIRCRLMIGGTSPSYSSYEQALAEQSGQRLPDESRGTFMLYSSGTTGQPKGVRFPLPETPAHEGDLQLRPSSIALYGYHEGDVYLSPAPLHHAAPLRVSCLLHDVGATVVVMERFDAELALSSIQKYGVTIGQWVPTMFVRMLKLPEQVREQYDLSTMRLAIHAAAPCPVDVKRAMIEWWGPILYEYYSGTENIGTTALDSNEWLAHPGSVGRAVTGVLHICDDDGRELPAGEAGLVYFERDDVTFGYHHDDAKTASIVHPAHPSWRTLGDMGHVDDDGYLYLSDRKAFMIISGGVNIYPQEIENALVMHPAVEDVAVFGVPNEEFGEEVKAVVQPRRWQDAGPALADELMAFARTRLASYKCPRSIDFDPQLPRMDNGKLYKKPLRERYWEGHRSRVL